MKDVLSDQASEMPGGGASVAGAIGVILNAVYFVVGIIAVIMIIIGGINIMTSAGNPTKSANGRRTIVFGLIGLVIALLAFAITSFILRATKGEAGL